ncbi:HAD family phosphatase [bacterium]|nr:HAD family phosphatase [bacterium]
MKLLCVDLDGTLLKNDKTISVEQIEAINSLKKHKVIFSISTGRPTKGIKKYLDLFNQKMPLSLFNGSLVELYPSGEVLYECKLIEKDARFIINHLCDLSVPFILYMNGDLYYKDENERVFNYIKYSNLEPIKISNIDEIDFKNIIKIIWFLNKDEEKNYDLDVFNKLESTTRIRSDFKFYEFVNSSASKGKTLKIIQDYYNIKDENTIAIGDEENDISMIKRAGIGVAMKNARDTVKAVADYITINDNENDGVLEVINKFIKKGDI